MENFSRKFGDLTLSAVQLERLADGAFRLSGSFQRDPDPQWHSVSRVIGADEPLVLEIDGVNFDICPGETAGALLSEDREAYGPLAARPKI